MEDKAIRSYLSKLRKNNNKEWFQAHKDEYDTARDEFAEIVSFLLKEVANFDDSVQDLDPKKCALRIHRDARFTKNKPPYHTAFRMAFPLKGDKSLTSAYYMNFDPENFFIGGGFVGAPNDAVNKVRQEIYCNWKDFEKILTEKEFKSNYDDLLKTEEFSLKRAPKGYEEDNPAIEYLKLKSFVAWRWIKIGNMSSDQLLEETVSAFKAVKPFLHFINRNFK